MINQQIISNNIERKVIFIKYVIKNNKYNLKADDIFSIGKRVNNSKRSFFFLGKLLGKSISVNPDVVKATGFLLSSLKYGFDNKSFLECITENKQPDYSNNAKDNVLVIGFCETATGIGMAVASSIEGCSYISTTREPIVGIKNILSFEEEHSHATTHKMFSNNIKLEDYDKIILVDDEITTGNSMFNLIKEINENSGNKQYSILTILDWRNEENKNKLEEFKKENNIDVTIYSLISGDIYTEECDNILHTDDIEISYDETFYNGELDSIERMTIQTDIEKVSYFKNSGRFGVSYLDILKTEEECKEAALKISKRIKEQKLLVLGHGENIYIPSRVAFYLKDLGKDVSFRTTTRSPIFCDGTIIKSKKRFLDRGENYYLYNEEECYENDKTVVLTETKLTTKLCKNEYLYHL